MGSQNAREKAPPVHVAREARAAAVPAPQTVVLSTPVAQPSTHASSPAPPPPAGDPPHPPASSWNFAYVPVRQPPPEHVASIASNKPSLPNAVAEALASTGTPLEPATRRWMETRLGHDFGAIRIHTDARAAASARALDAAAAASGSHILFASGAYRPYAREGRALIAHELTHVVQHRAFPYARRNPLLSQPGHAAERQADAIARQFFSASAVASWSPVAPVSQISLAPATWYRGFAVGVPPALDGKVVHDLGGGVYFTDTPEVAQLYASIRASGNTAAERVVGGALDPHSLGAVYDLREDAFFMGLFTHLRKGGPVSGERYRPLVDAAFRRQGKKIDDFAVIIGPEGVRGGTQMVIHDQKVASGIVQGMKPVAASGGGSASPPAQPGGTGAVPPPETPGGGSAEASPGAPKAEVPSPGAAKPNAGAGNIPQQGFKITPQDMQNLHKYTTELMNSLDEQTRGEILVNGTLAVGLVKDPDGELTLVFTTNRNRKYKGLEAAAEKLGITRWKATPRAEGRGEVGAPGDAEQLMIEAADANGFAVEGMAITRKLCPDCTHAVQEEAPEAIPTIKVDIPPPKSVQQVRDRRNKAPGKGGGAATPETPGSPGKAGSVAEPSPPPKVAASGSGGKAASEPDTPAAKPAEVTPEPLPETKAPKAPVEEKPPDVTPETPKVVKPTVPEVEPSKPTIPEVQGEPSKPTVPEVHGAPSKPTVSNVEEGGGVPKIPAGGVKEEGRPGGGGGAGIAIFGFILVILQMLPDPTEGQAIQDKLSQALNDPKWQNRFKELQEQASHSTGYLYYNVHFRLTYSAHTSGHPKQPAAPPTLDGAEILSVDLTSSYISNMTDLDHPDPPPGAQPVIGGGKYWKAHRTGTVSMHTFSGQQSARGAASKTSLKELGDVPGLTSDSEIRDWVSSHRADAISEIGTDQKIRMINRLLDGVISKADLEAVRKIWTSIPSASEAREVREAIEPRTHGALFFHEDEMQAIFALPNGGSPSGSSEKLAQPKPAKPKKPPETKPKGPAYSRDELFDHTNRALAEAKEIRADGSDAERAANYQELWKIIGSIEYYQKSPRNTEDEMELRIMKGKLLNEVSAQDDRRARGF